MRTERRTALAAATALAVASLASAADVSFDPSLLASYYQDGNVDVVSEDGTSRSDDASVVSLTLPVTVTNPGSSFRFSYTPSGQFYRENTDRNNTAHRVLLGYDRDLTPRDTLAVALWANRSEYQRLEPDEPDRPLTFLPRTRQTTLDFSVDGTNELGRRSEIRWGLSSNTFWNEGEEALPYDDSTTVSGRFGWDFAATSRTSAGFVYRAAVTDFEVGEDTVSHSAGYAGTTTTRREVELDYTLGVIAADDGSGYSTDLGVSFTASWSPRPENTLSAGARQDISQGRGLGGSTIDRGVYLGWRWVRPEGLGVTVTTGYWDREGLQGQSPTQSLYTSETLSWGFGQYLRLGVFHTYRDQRDDGAGDFDTSYHSGGVALVWTMLGPRG